MSQPAFNIIETPHQAATLLQHPIRRQLMAELSEPRSAAGLAKIIKLPRQKVNYHLRELEKAGLVTAVEENTRGNAKERIVVATASHYLLDPTLLAPEAGELPDAGDRFSLMHLIGVMARGISDLLKVRRKAAKAEKRVATLSLESQVSFANAEARHAYVKALTNEIARLNAEFHQPSEEGSRTFTVFLGAWPTITRNEVMNEETHEQD